MKKLRAGGIALIVIVTGALRAGAADISLPSSYKTAQEPSWDGLYAGVSVGVSWLDGSAPSSSLDTSTSSDAIVAPFPLTILANRTTTVVTSTSSVSQSSRAVGTNGDLFVGYNVRLSSVYVGMQVEAGVSNVASNLTRTATSTATTTTVITPTPAGAGFGLASSATSATTLPLFSAVPTNEFLANRSLMSALARAGWLTDPFDLVYLLGGWTYGRFEFGAGAALQSQLQNFALNGPTFGAGVERQVGSGWTLKLEYRYTKFQGKDLTYATRSTGSTPSPFPGAPATALADVFTETTHVSANLQTVRLGITHYFASP